MCVSAAASGTRNHHHQHSQPAAARIPGQCASGSGRGWTGVERSILGPQRQSLAHWLPRCLTGNEQGSTLTGLDYLTFPPAPPPPPPEVWIRNTTPTNSSLLQLSSSPSGQLQLYYCYYRHLYHLYSCTQIKYNTKVMLQLFTFILIFFSPSLFSFYPFVSQHLTSSPSPDSLHSPPLPVFSSV